MNIAELSFISILVIMVAFYLILVRPSQQEQKRQQQTIRELQVGDEVLTTSGFYARIKEVHTPEEGPVQLLLDLGNGLEIRSLTTAVASRVSAAEEPAERPEGAKGA